MTDTSGIFDHHRWSRYGLLAQALAGDIASGRYPVGSVIPTEQALCQKYAVSRHTVRQALNELKNRGILSAQAGVGTTVRGKPQSARFSSASSGIAELLQFDGETQIRIISQAEVIADSELAKTLLCVEGQAWSRLITLRAMRDELLPIAYVIVYIRAEFSKALENLPVLEKPVYSFLEESYGVRITEVQQSMGAESLSAEMATILSATEGAPAMQIIRHFFERDGRIVQVSMGYYPHGRYRQQTNFRATSENSNS